MVNVTFDMIEIMKSFRARLSGCVIRVVGDDYVQNFGWDVPWHISTWTRWDVGMVDKVPKMEGERN
jgi:hypothetical protein